MKSTIIALSPMLRHQKLIQNYKKTVRVLLENYFAKNVLSVNEIDSYCMEATALINDLNTVLIGTRNLSTKNITYINRIIFLLAEFRKSLPVTKINVSKNKAKLLTLVC